MVYWFEKLKDGKCTASNQTIAEILNCQPLSVANSLKRLEDCGYILRVFKDKKKKIRSEIKTLVSFAYHQTMKQVSSNDDTAQDQEVSSNDEQNNNSINNNRNKSGTPFAEAGDFFDAFKRKDKKLIEFVRGVAVKYQITEQQAFFEFQKFVNYWTELSRSGRAQRWQSEKFFQVGRRLTTWFSKIKKPKGRMII